MTVVVIGAHGRTGRAVVEELLEEGFAVTGTVREPAHVADLQGAGANGQVVDLSTAAVDDLRQAMAGADAVVYAAGSRRGDTPELVAQIDGEAITLAADAAVLAGVERFVHISSHRADEDFGGDAVVHLLRSTRMADAHVRGTSLGCTIIRPDALTEERPTGRVELGHRVRHGSIPRADLADLVRRVLQTPSSARRQFEVVGGSTPIHLALQS